jgi:outer membrane protein
MTNRVFLIAAAVLSLATAGSWVVQAAQAQNPAFSLAFVDLKRVSTEYEGTKRSQAELNAFQESLRKQLDDLENIRFLNDAEHTEMDQLRAAATPTDAQKKRMQDLLDTSKSRSDQFRALQQNPNKSDAEKTQLDSLTKMSNDTDTKMDALSSKLDDQLQQKGEELSKQLTDTVTAAITDVAKNKSYSVVLDKQAVLYGGSDMTDDVLAQLGKK